VVCGDRVDPHGAVEAVMLGAEAVVHAGCSPARLLEACEVVALGGSSFDPDQARALATAARSRAQLGPGRLRLTGREVDILTSIQRGDAMKQTARTLGISIKTVENLQGRLYRKLGVRNRAHAMARAHSMGFVGTPQHTASP
jgi:DNA-binding NarL/FixJ family response regulator